MKNQKIGQVFHLVLTPTLLIALGVVLALRPDAASELIGRLLGWLLIAIGLFSAGYGIFTRGSNLRGLIPALICFILGAWLLRNPLQLAAALGRIVGLLIVVRSAADIRNALTYHSGMLYAALACAAGVVLVVLPMTTSRLIFTLCGIVVAVLGIVMLLDRLKHGIDSSEKDIIDI